MEGNFEDKLRKAHEWFSKKADTVHARIWLGVFSFTESCVFIIPPDPLLAAMVFVRKERWVRYALITSITSIIGAIVGYIIGAVLFKTIGLRLIEIYNLQAQVKSASTLINDNVFVFILTAAFTPIPFKVAVITAGFTKANFISFLVAVIGGRSARYFLIAYVAKIFGANADKMMKKFWWITTGIGTLIFIVYAIFYFLK